MIRLRTIPSTSDARAVTATIARAESDLRAGKIPAVEHAKRTLKKEGVEISFSPEAKEILRTAYRDDLIESDSEDAENVSTAARTPAKREMDTGHLFATTLSGSKPRSAFSDISTNAPASPSSAKFTTRESDKISSLPRKKDNEELVNLVRSCFVGEQVFSYLVESRPQTIARIEDYRIDLQGYFTNEDTGRRYANYQIQINKKRAKGESTTISAVLVEIPNEKGLEYSYNPDILLEAFEHSISTKSIVILESSKRGRVPASPAPSSIASSSGSSTSSARKKPKSKIAHADPAAPSEVGSTTSSKSSKKKAETPVATPLDSKIDAYLERMESLKAAAKIEFEESKSDDYSSSEDSAEDLSRGAGAARTHTRSEGSSASRSPVLEAFSPTGFVVPSRSSSGSLSTVSNGDMQPFTSPVGSPDFMSDLGAGRRLSFDEANSIENVYSLSEPDFDAADDNPLNSSIVSASSLRSYELDELYPDDEGRISDSDEVRSLPFIHGFTGYVIWNVSNVRTVGHTRDVEEAFEGAYEILSDGIPFEVVHNMGMDTEDQLRRYAEARVRFESALEESERDDTARKLDFSI